MVARTMTKATAPAIPIAVETRFETPKERANSQKLH